jgi:hypothetical protein
MNSAWKSWFGGALMGLVVLMAVAEEPGSDATAGVAMQAAPSSEPAANADKMGFGVSITVDGTDDESRAAEDDNAGTAERVLGSVQRVLKNLPAEIRAEISEEDRRELDEALAEIENLERAEHPRRIVLGAEDDDGIVELVAIMLLFGGPIIIVAIVSFNNRRKRQMVHQTIEKLIEHGKDVPVELLDALDKGMGGKTSLARGTINVALGIGIGVALWNLADASAATIGLIPLCIGLAQLIVWKLESGAASLGSNS